jgi:hypothetical protein
VNAILLWAKRPQTALGQFNGNQKIDYIVKLFMKSKLFVRALLLLLFATSLSASATHIVGGELYYRYLGNDDYEIRLTVYRDCYNGIPPFDDPAYVGIWDFANNLVMEVAMSPNDSATVPSTINSPCFQPPTGICVRVANYYAIVNLSALLP